MYDFMIVRIIVTILLIIGISGLCITKTKKKNILAQIFFIFSFIIYISFLICIGYGKHIDPNVTYTQYQIQRLTTSHVSFSNYEYHLQDTPVVIELPNEEYINVVVVEKETYVIQWLCKVKLTNEKYHVFLSKENYERLLSKDVIYERK